LLKKRTGHWFKFFLLFIVIFSISTDSFAARKRKRKRKKKANASNVITSNNFSLFVSVGQLSGTTKSYENIKFQSATSFSGGLGVELFWDLILGGFYKSAPSQKASGTENNLAVTIERNVNIYGAYLEIPMAVDWLYVKGGYFQTSSKTIITQGGIETYNQTYRSTGYFGAGGVKLSGDTFFGFAEYGYYQWGFTFNGTTSPVGMIETSAGLGINF
jgi:hypothetical protein